MFLRSAWCSVARRGGDEGCAGGGRESRDGSGAGVPVGRVAEEEGKHLQEGVV